jgi:hypothetical protein
MKFKRIEVRNPILTQFERDKIEDKLCRIAIAAMAAFCIPFSVSVSLTHWMGLAA